MLFTAPTISLPRRRSQPRPSPLPVPVPLPSPSLPPHAISSWSIDSSSFRFIIVISHLHVGARPFPPAVIGEIRCHQVGRCAAHHTDITLQTRPLASEAKQL